MRRIALFLAAMATAGCSAVPDQSTGPHRAAQLPNFALNDPAGVDTGDGRKIDLVVDQQTTQNNWIVRVEDLPASFCSVEEGGITPGVHTLIRFTVTTPNIGAEDNFIGSPWNHFLANDGLYEMSLCHHHFHFRNYTLYELVDPATGKVWKAAKRGFCMLDTDPAPAWYGQPPRQENYESCGLTDVVGSGFQGISHGWSDTYVWTLGGQYFVLDGGDGQAVVPPGTYWIRITVDPPYDPPAGGVCPRFTDTHGKCHQFDESNYDNNQIVATVVIPDHPGRGGYGPLKASSASSISAADDIDHVGKP